MTLCQVCLTEQALPGEDLCTFCLGAEEREAQEVA
jgi:hypothetical protein